MVGIGGVLRVRRWRAAQLRPTVGVNQPLSVPRPPDRCAGGANERGRSSELGRKTGAIVRIRYHRKVPCHVDTSNEDRFDIIAMSCAATERNPGIVVVFRVFFKDEFKFDVFPISGVLCDKRCPLFLVKFE